MENQKSNVSVSVHNWPFLVSHCPVLSSYDSSPLRRPELENGGVMNLAGKQLLTRNDFTVFCIVPTVVLKIVEYNFRTVS